MARILSLSSQVVYGHVGNSVAGFMLQRFGHEVMAAPTVLLSNRPGYGAIAALPMPAPDLHRLLTAIADNGWFQSLDAVMTGYLPSAGHVDVSATWIERLRRERPGLFYLCDPILGDDHTGIYIDEAAACAVRDKLLPLCDVATPNAFELGWLTGQRIESEKAAIAAARALRIAGVIVTSAPVVEGPDYLGNILVESEGAVKAVTRRRIVQAHGTGDFFAAQFLGRKLNGLSHAEALQQASIAIEAVLEASAGQPELALVKSQDLWGPSEAL